MSTKQKLAYFWEYYKIHTFVVIIIIVIAVSLIKQYVTNKDYAFYAVLINAVTTDTNSGLNEIWSEEFLEYAQIDSDEYQVDIDTSISLAESIDIEYTIANQQRLVAMMMTGDIGAFVADTEAFETYAQSEFFYDMESLLSDEELMKYGAYFYYTDAADYDNVNNTTSDIESTQEDPAALNINHRDPSTMEHPVAVGIVLTEDNMIADSGFYSYLTEAGYEYQGYPSDVVLGIPATYKEPELTVRFLEYIFSE